MNLLVSESVDAVWRLTEGLKRAPATLALLIQVIALLTTWGVAQGMTTIVQLAHLSDFQQIPILALVALQSVTAWAYAYKAKMANWWLRIHFTFPIALYITFLFNLNNAIFLTGFIVSVLLYWTVFKTQVPFYPSRPAVWRTVDQFIQHQFRKLQQPINIIEIGSGLGDFSMYLDNRSHLYQVKGIEVAPLPWLISYCRAQLKKSNVCFTLGNYDNIDFAEHHVVFAYLSPAAMPALWEKASREMRAGSLLISLEFDIPGVKPYQVIHTDKHNPKLYVWQFA